MIIVQSLIKIVKTVNCKQIDQVKKKRKKERKERNRTEQNNWIDWEEQCTHTSTNTHTYIHAYHMRRKPAVRICMYIFLYISFMYCAYLPCWTRLRSSDCQCWRLQLPVNKTRIVSLLENVDSSAGASIKETAIYRIGSQFDIF